VERLTHVKDLLVSKVPHLMSTYFPLLLEFRSTSDPAEKQIVIGVVMDCVNAVPEFGLLTAAIGLIRQMLNDAFPTVVKAALLTARRLMLVSIQSLCTSNQSHDSKRLMWDALVGVTDNIVAPDLTAHKAVGVRMLTFKVIEQLSLILSPSHMPASNGSWLPSGSCLQQCFIIQMMCVSSLHSFERRHLRARSTITKSLQYDFKVWSGLQMLV
jgi:hypothetical protein